MIKGGCLCGKIQFVVDGPILGMVNCHCSDCRKAYGSAFGTEALCEKDDFRYVKGEALISSYKQSERITREFCGVCESPLPLRQDWYPQIGIPGGLLDDDPQVIPSQHIFVGDKAPWWEITDDKPQHEAYPPGVDPTIIAEL